MIALLIFIIILSVLVLVHEFGHFYAARKNNVQVEEFGYGLPPKIWGKKFGDTEYTINLLPFGGFVRITGEEDLEESSDPNNFMSKSPVRRLSILLAGIFMNVALAIFLYYVFFFVTGFKSLALPVFFDHSFKYGRTEQINTVVTDFLEGSAAESSGLSSGEAIIEIDNTPVYSVADMRGALEDKANVPVKLLVMDIRRLSRPTRVVEITPQANEDGAGFLGTVLNSAIVLDYSDNKLTAGFSHSYNVMSYTFSTLKSLVGVSYEEKSIEPVSGSVSGPVGIFSVVDSILRFSGKEAILGLIDLTALLSLSLAIINLMPFPALDGGRVLFVLIEMLRGGKRVSAKVETAMHKWGILILLALMVLVTFRDVKNLLG
ncbi:MAG: M50 family metallopeptidase [Patescibacteria group bacterium]